VVYPGRPWFPADPPGPFLRLTFAGAPPEALDEGVRRLALALSMKEGELSMGSARSVRGRR
jgi:DNA-binding transcriptional MocR family regulator